MQNSPVLTSAQGTIRLSITRLLLPARIYLIRLRASIDFGVLFAPAHHEPGLRLLYRTFVLMSSLSL
jgi:hypothetical protein